MATGKVTYITYNEGIESKKLHLGNLVHDFTTPTIYEPYVEKAYTEFVHNFLYPFKLPSSPPNSRTPVADRCSVAEPAPFWATHTSLENFALTLAEEKDKTDAKTGHRYQVAAAPKGVKVEIKDPVRFFENVTLKSETAQKWLLAHISACLNSSSKPKPEVWLLTGLILLTHTTWSSLSSVEKFVPGTAAPFDPTGVTQLRRLSASGNVRPVFGLEDVVSGAEGEGKRVGERATVHETGKYPGTRAWAAQWKRVDVSPLKAEEWDGELGQLKLKLKSGKEAFAEVEVSSDKGEDFAREGERAEFDDAFWDKYLDDVEELMQSL